MGTQFASRLQARDAQRVISAIKAARHRIIAAGDEEEPSREKNAPLRSKKRRQLATAIFSEVLMVAEDHSFSDLFEKSKLFEKVLDWLVGLRIDAAYNAFQNSIGSYDLERSRSPVSQLNDALRELIRSLPGSEADPFRVATSAAAGGVLAQAMSQPLGKLPDESDAEHYGRRLAELHLREVVETFIYGFVKTFVAAVLRKADPKQVTVPAGDETELSEDAADAIAKRAIRRIDKAGALTEPSRVHQILLDQFRRLQDQRAREGEDG